MSMTCLVCHAETEPFLEKDFLGHCGLEKCQYVQCIQCGLVMSKTHYEMTEQEWEQVNAAFHSVPFERYDYGWKLRLSAQRDAIVVLRDAGILPTDRLWLDWGCGGGELVRMLKERGCNIAGYDRYSQTEAEHPQLKPQAYGLVTASSVFEHIRDIDALNGIAALVSTTGALMVHTGVFETVPKEPTWYYYMAGHCTVFTPKTMQVLFKKWGFTGLLHLRPIMTYFMLRDKLGEAHGFAAGHSGQWTFKDGF